MNDHSTEKPETNGFDRAKRRDPASGRFVDGWRGGGRKRMTVEERMKRKALRTAQEKLEAESAALTQAAIDSAKSGDVGALRLCLERIFPPPKAETAPAPLPGIDAAPEVAADAIMRALAAGLISPERAAMLLDIVQARAEIDASVILAEKILEFERILQTRGMGQALRGSTYIPLPSAQGSQAND